MDERVHHLAGDLFGLDALALTALRERPRPSAFGGTVVPARARDVEFAARDWDPTLLERVELVAALRAHVDPHHADASHLHPAVDASIAALGDERSSAVVASARPAFFGGPLEVLYAALHAVALARALAREHDRPVVPILWIDSDAHESADARGAWLLNRHLDLTHSALPSMGSGRRPLASIALDERAHRLDSVRGQLRQLLPETEHTGPAIELFAPRAGETLGAAMRRAYGALLGDLGLVCMEPFALRDTYSRALARCVTAGDAALVDASPIAGAVALADDERVPLHRTVEGQREPLRLVGRDFVYADEDTDRAGSVLAAEIADRPTEFTAGPLLAPLARDLVLPVVATIANPADLRVHAATSAWRDAMGAPRPALVPRQHATLVSAMAREALTKRGVELEAVLRARGAWAQSSDDADERPPVLDALKAVVARHTDELDELRGELFEIEKGLAHRLRRTAKENADRIEKLRTRAERVVQNRAGKARRHERRLSNTLCPKGRPQEEVLTTAQYASAFGTAWIAALAEAVDPFASEHLVLEL